MLIARLSNIVHPVLRCCFAAGRAAPPAFHLRALLGVVVFLLGGVIAAQAYPNEVYTGGGAYRWKIDNVEAGSTADLATAINNCIAQTSGVREVHVLAGGDLASTITMQSGLRLYCHGVSFTRSHGGTGFHHEGGGDIRLYDMNLTSGGGWGIHTSRASNLTFQGINITSGGIGIRVDSHPSRPYEAGRWVYNLTVSNCRFENLGSHGLETYGVDGFTIDNIVARNNGECGVLINKGYNGTIGTVDAYRCSNGGGYAGLRFANDCANVWVKSLRAVECGRGFFSVTGAKNIVVEDVYIRDCTSHAILLQNSDGVGVNSGSYNGVALNHYTSVNSWILARDVSGGAVAAPAAPGGVAAFVGDSGVAITWPAVSGATHYLLQRAEAVGGPYRTIAYFEATSFEDRNLTGDATYFYVVKAVNAGGPGAASSPVSASTGGRAFPVMDLDAGLRLHYPFDGSGAESRGGPAASISGPPIYAAGLVNQALVFDGAANFATLQPLAGPDLRNFTAAAWIWPSSDANWQRVFDFGGGTSDYLILTLVNGALRFNLCRSGSIQGFETPAPPRDRWAHVAVTFAGNWATLYVDGAARGKMLFGNNPAQLGLSQNFLGKSQFPDPLFHGRLDDFRLYTRGLGSSEVMALVTSSPPVSPFGLTAGGFGTRVGLTWASVVNASTYNVKRSTVSGGPYTTVATGLAGTSHTDTGLSSGATYYYVVTASNPHGESADSDEAAATTSDLVARITFNETSGSVAADSSGNSRNASLVNGPAFSPGVLKNALTLSSASSQHATLPAGVVSELDDFTFSLWVRVSTFESWARVLDFGTGTTNYLFLAPQYATGASAAKMRFAIRTPSTGEQTITSSTALPPDTWAHVAVTRSGTTARMYLNGTLVGTNTAMTLKPSDLGVTTLNYLGRSQFNDPYFNGSMDDFRIYARALSAGELTALANPVAEAPDTLVAFPDDGKVSLSWALADGATHYHVLRASTRGGPYATIAANVVASTYEDSSLTNGTTYHYVVTGGNSRGESAGTSPVATATPTTLRVHLRLDETSGATATDSSGRGRDATTVNNPGWSAGRLNNALQLGSASSQYASLPSGVVDGLADFTISTWVRVNSFANWARIFDFGTGTTNYLFLVAQYDGTNAPRRMRFATRSTSVTTEQQITSSAALPLNTWAHVAVTLSGTTGRLYLNGVLVGTNTAMTLNPSGLGAVTQGYLGKSMFGADPYFNGAIDDFRVMTVALGAAQITELAAPPAAPSGLDAVSGNQQVTLGWSAVADATGYAVKRSLVSGGPYVTVASNVSGAAYTDIGLGNGTTYHYVVSALKGVAESGDSAEASATPILSLAPIESWRLTHFGSSANDGSGADFADPDGDGLANLLEYGLGADPGAVTAAPYQLQVSDGVLRLVFERIADPDLVYEVEASPDLVQWTVIWSSTGSDNTEGVVAVSDGSPLSASSRRFLRLKVSTATL
jgi:fibronectin type 3 domain-containing protein